MAIIGGNSSEPLSPKDQPIDFCTLGMFIIDDIYPPATAADQTPQLNIIGGAGTYSAVGARLLSPPPTSRSVGWIIDAGTDFPPELRTHIAAWRTSALIRPRDAPTTRGWNGYGANDHRAFKYLTAKKRLTAEDLPSGSGAEPALLASRGFHLICSAGRCVELSERILQRRRDVSRDGPDSLAPPLIIWEPVPDLCVPAELQATYAALRHVDVVSPNHEELGALFGFEHPSSGVVDRGAVEAQVNELLARGVGRDGDGAVVVRAGREGCFVASLQKRKWLCAYHADSAKVVDPTGGGNGFLGGFAVGLVRSGGDVVEAARWGAVAASLCIEQVGVPILTAGQGTSEATSELWNGIDVIDRLEEYRRRTS